VPVSADAVLSKETVVLFTLIGDLSSSFFATSVVATLPSKIVFYIASFLFNEFYCFN
jgi:hypothetical protein